jgi:two-component system phosphate regulon sensor histidine kinase PhoR
MFFREKPNWVYFALVLAIVIAGAILGYYTYVTASQVEKLGEQSILESTLVVAKDKVEKLEQQIIQTDHSVFQLVQLDTPTPLDQLWTPLAPQISPSVRAVLILDEQGKLVDSAIRSANRDKKQWLRFFSRSVVPDLQLIDNPQGQLKHLHKTYDEENYLFSYIGKRHQGVLYWVVLHHDVGYILREVLPYLFTHDATTQLYNVVDENNRRVFGPSLAKAGVYFVEHHFPTTLYGWRVQVAPVRAPQLQANVRSRRTIQVAMLLLSFAVISLGVAFILVASHKDRKLGALKSEFIANVSHELKTPLSVIRMFAEMLLTKRIRSEAKTQDYLEIMLKETERLSALIDNVLDFAALEQGKQRYELRDCNLSEVVQRGVDAMRYRLERDGVSIVAHSPPDPVSVRVDEQAIVLAVVNLLDNAVKYGGATPIQIEIQVQDDHVEVTVRDHGPGITPSDLRRVFERFYRTSAGRNVRGSGIGLSLVRQIAEAHGGKAWARNHPEGGAVVGFQLPLLTPLQGAILRQ